MSRQEIQISDNRVIQKIQNLDIVACYKCDKIFKSEEDFLKHYSSCMSIRQERITSVQQRKEYKCMTCSEIFYKKRILINHYKKIPHHYHKKIYYKKILYSGRKCPFCDQVFRVKKSIRNLFVHIKTIHDSESDNDLFKSICDEYANYQETAVHCCDQCGKTFNVIDTLRNHVEVIHGSGRIICSECGVVLKSLRTLKSHMSRKHRKVPIPCEKCGSLFETKSILRTHIRKVHMQIKYMCKICDKRFSELQHVKNHKLAVHEKLKPFTCLDCDFRTAAYGNLNLHRNNTHKKRSLPKAEYDLIVRAKDCSEDETNNIL